VAILPLINTMFKQSEKLRKQKMKYQKSNKGKIAHRKADRKYKKTKKSDKGHKKRLDRNKNYIKSYKESHPCSICGESRITCLDFHHINDDKYQTLAILGSSDYSLKAIKEEIKKCIVVCANCHRIIHSK